MLDLNLFFFACLVINGCSMETFSLLSIVMPRPWHKSIKIVIWNKIRATELNGKETILRPFLFGIGFIFAFRIYGSCIAKTLKKFFLIKHLWNYIYLIKLPPWEKQSHMATKEINNAKQLQSTKLIWLFIALAGVQFNSAALKFNCIFRIPIGNQYFWLHFRLPHNMWHTVHMKHASSSSGFRVLGRNVE